MSFWEGLGGTVSDKSLPCEDEKVPAVEKNRCHFNDRVFAKVPRSAAGTCFGGSADSGIPTSRMGMRHKQNNPDPVAQCSDE